MSCQKTFAAYHHLNLELVSFSVFNAFITEQIRAAEIGRLSRTQELLLQVSFQEITVYVDISSQVQSLLRLPVVWLHNFYKTDYCR